jgi:hypothetical protein
MPMSPRLLRPRASGTNVASDADARAYIESVRLADGQYMEPAVQLAVNDFVAGCKTDGIWSAITGAALLMGARTLSGALTPLVGGAITNNGAFVSGDYNRKAGLAGNGSNYLRPSTSAGPTEVNSSMSVYSTTGQFDLRFIAGWNSSNCLATLTAKSARSSSSTAHSFSNQNGVQFAGFSRSASGSFFARNGGVTDTANIVAGGSGALGQFGVFALGNNTNLISTHRIAFYHCGLPLDLALLDSRVTALYNAIGTAIP